MFYVIIFCCLGTQIGGCKQSAACCRCGLLVRYSEIPCVGPTWSSLTLIFLV